MRQNRFILALLVFTILLGDLSTSWAHGGEEHGEGVHSDSENKSANSPAEILKIIEIRQRTLAKVVADKKLDDVHEQVFGIRDAAKELPALVAPEKRSKVESTVANISNLAVELDKSGDAGNQVSTEANLKKMDGLLKMLSSQVS